MIHWKLITSAPQSQKGFTIVEILVTITVAMIITGFMITNFSRSRTDLNQSVLAVVDAIRSAQTQALSGSLVSGTYRCGFGIRFTGTNTYSLYMGPDSAVTNCSLQNRNFDGADSVTRTWVLTNSALTFAMPISDIFFEPPNPTTYINNVTGGAVAEAAITIRRNGSTSCPSVDCRTVYVSTSGLIRTQ